YWGRRPAWKATAWLPGRVRLTERRGSAPSAFSVLIWFRRTPGVIVQSRAGDQASWANRLVSKKSESSRWVKPATGCELRNTTPVRSALAPNARRCPSMPVYSKAWAKRQVAMLLENPKISSSPNDWLSRLYESVVRESQTLLKRHLRLSGTTVLPQSTMNGSKESWSRPWYTESMSSRSFPRFQARLPWTS